MRVLFSIVLVLLLLFGVGLGLSVMWRGAPATSVGAASMPASLGGKPQGHIYSGAVGPYGEPSNVIPLTTFHPLGCGLVLQYTHDSLLDLDPATAALRPALAESYEVSADATTCTFTLRPDVVFSDGSPLTMADVQFGWELAQAGHLEMGSLAQAFARIASIDWLDARRFRVHFKDRHYAAVQAVGMAWVIASSEFFRNRVRSLLTPTEAMPAVATKRFATLLNLIETECGPGTGPYVLHNEPIGMQSDGGEEPQGRTNWIVRQEILLTRHEQSWHRKVRPGTWNFAGIRTLFQNPANALLRGEVDWFSDPQLDQLLAAHPRLAVDYHKYVYDRPDLGCYRIVWNCKQEPFEDVRVRRAMGMLVHRSEAVEVLAGCAKPASSHAKPGSPEYPEIAPLPFDPAVARQLLREAGYDAEQGKPLRFTLLTYQGHEPTRRIVELFVGAAKAIGVEVQVHALPSAGLVAEKKQGDWHGFLAMQFFESWADPYRFLNSVGLENEGGWVHADADRLTTTARAEFNGDRRAQLWRQLHVIAHDEQPAALIVHPLASMLFSRKIEDCVPGPLGLKVDRAWVAPENQRR